MAKPGLFLYSFFSQCKDKYSTNLAITDESVDGTLRTRTQVNRMAGADEPTELWRHPFKFVSLFNTIRRR